VEDLFLNEASFQRLKGAENILDIRHAFREIPSCIFKDE
jgi:hypothetical protein